MEQHKVDRHVGSEESTGGVEVQVDEVGQHHLETHPLGIGLNHSCDRLVVSGRAGAIDPPPRGNE
jgi:hypothetical protein